MTQNKGKLYLCGNHIGNPADLSEHAVACLSSCDIIAAEDTRTIQPLIRGLLSKPLCLSLHEHNEKKRIQTLQKLLDENKNVALISEAGMPLISDPGYPVTRFLIAEGYEVCCVPGPNAAITALVLSGLPPHPFIFLGFLPRKKGDLITQLQQYSTLPSTLIFYEAPHRVMSTLQHCLSCLGNRPMALCRELTKIHEEVLRGSIQYVYEQLEIRPRRGEMTLVINGCSQEKTVFSAKDIFIKDIVNSSLSNREKVQFLRTYAQLRKQEATKLVTRQTEEILKDEMG